ncbi:MAG TPA: hypothetical protein VJR89_28805 [Polyangiales bacterium]|nr:hypothetical protein [Polyangiales bacterium]
MLNSLRIPAFIRARAILVLTCIALCACASDASPSRTTPGAGRTAGTGGSASAGTGSPGWAGTSSGPSGLAGAPIVPPPSTGTTQPLAPQGDRQKIVIDDCPGMLSAQQAHMLAQANGGASSGRWLYPYEKTVFPLGLAAPLLQWELPEAQAIHLRLSSMLFDYSGCFGGNADSRLAIPQAVWERAGQQSRGQPDPLIVELTVLTNGNVVKLPKLSLIFALANLKSAIYYNTYGSLIANQMGIIGGVVMRVVPGRDKPDVFLSAPSPVTHCVGCHSVSADGSRMVAEIHLQPGTGEGPSASFDLSSVGLGTNPKPLRDNLSRAGFAGLYPDGSVYLTTARLQPGPIGSLPGTAPGNVPGTFGPEISKLYDTNTGTEIPNSGIVEYAYMPMFSVDGTVVAFNHMDASGVSAGHTLAVMDYDRTARKFTNLRKVYNHMTQYPSWPFFLPDVVEKGQEFELRLGKRLVFQVGETPDFVTQDQPVGVLPHPSDLWWLDVDSGKAVPLNRANGLDAQGQIYLPYGERDAHKNYIPTVSPVAAGGYFWVFFSSKRNYGSAFVADPPELRNEGKKIWVTAIDINAPAGTDPSHPAFFLPGQEIESGNIRAFAALEPCRENGTMCASGIDCCCGFCTDGKCACKVECAKLDERCTTADDCCDKTLSCIGGFCGQIVGPM